MPVPANPKIYHIVHVDRLPSIIADGFLWSDAEATRRGAPGTTIGMDKIKRRRLNELQLESHAGLHVGECAPFYFCPRSVMLHRIHMGNDSELAYQGGQGPIVHLQADLRQAVAWADSKGRRWAFTASSAASYRFKDYCDLSQLDKVDWNVVGARFWQGFRDAKQAEFLMERSFPWELVEFIGVLSPEIRDRVRAAMLGAGHQPVAAIMPGWYY